VNRLSAPGRIPLLGTFVNTFQVSTKEANLPAILKGSLAFGGTTNPILKVFCKIGLLLRKTHM